MLNRNKHPRFDQDFQPVSKELLAAIFYFIRAIERSTCTRTDAIFVVFATSSADS